MIRTRVRIITCQHCRTSLGWINRGRTHCNVYPGVAVSADLPLQRSDLFCPTCRKVRRITGIIVRVPNPPIIVIHSEPTQLAASESRRSAG